MKKLTTLVLAAGLVVSSFAGSASAAEFKPFAQFAEEFVYGDAGFESPENFNATTRIRFGFDYVASEDLSATLLFQYRKGSWGNNGDDFTADPSAEGFGNGDHFRVRLAYIDWTIPTTEIKVRMGRQALAAPSYAFGSAVLDGRGDAVSVFGDVNENINLGLAWIRVDSEINNAKYVFDETTKKDLTYKGDDSDALMLQAEFAYDGWKVAPWAMYIHTQPSAMDYTVAGFGKNRVANAFVIGASAELSMFDPFVFALDALYSNTNYDLVPADGNAEDTYDAWYVGAKADYKFSNGTASLKGWYASGQDERGGNHINDGGMVVLDGGFGATDIVFDGSIIGTDGFYDQSGLDSPFGTWGIVAEYSNFSFMEKLTHTARVAYISGTNDNINDEKAHDIFSTGGMSENDSVIEFNFDSTYEIYKNFSATLQLGYAIIDQDLAAGEEEQDNIFRSALAFVYNF